MCGITGVLAFTEAGKAVFGKLEAASAMLTHRGPDADGIFKHGRIGLANRRLSVIAPEASANQPLTTADGRYTIVYNGEIFNYKMLRHKLQDKGYTFETDSDTEIILQLYAKYGQDCLKKLRGFFAFAIYDTLEDSLFIARDRFGEKPLLYFKDADTFLFGSEMGAMFALGVPREVDFVSLYQYLQLTYVPAPASMVKSVKKLLPGHSLFIKGNKVQEHVWYRLPFDAEKAEHGPLNYKQQQVKLCQLLEQAVAERLTADVPVGAFLSGGIDSSVVVALAAKQVPNLKTYSLGFEGEPYFDETSYARLVARKYKTDHTELRVTNDQLYANLSEMLDNMSEPFADASALAVYTLAKRARQDVKVVLSGDGADELFAGYNKHHAEYKLLSGGFDTAIVTGLHFLWNMLPKSRNSFTANKVRQLQRFAAGAQLSPKNRYWLWATWQTESAAIDLLGQKHKRQADNRLYAARKSRLLDCINENLYSINSVLCADWHLVLGNDMLPKTDLMGMANGLEIRSPFLDHRLVKFAFSLPVQSKIDAGIRKKILQDTFKTILPPELYKRPKQGFEIPLLSLLKTQAKDLTEMYLSEDFVESQGIFDVGQVNALRKALYTSAAGTVQTQVWTLLVFQHWWQKWIKPEPNE
ncbi:asparagine synthase (glutamine-hydrolyzing) [Pontibacter vulgaris]|uniref:asparagine synthase (glutamine-hydrolyzing) n=1 Tax=Pontibacter vulgaris TaxID=2905679 RepID=UPI001FA7DA8F|nr:asparagine synthase (glutamine-hydrolyzing) [Pontibacter vulgaris]